MISPPTVRGVSSNIVISQVYGGGGNAGTTYKNDFIELFNRGNTSVNVTGWSVQYTSAAGTTWQVTNLTNISIAPGQYYLVQEGVGAGGTTNLPTPDATGTIAMSSTAGKVALVNTTTALTGVCPTGASIIDFVGFGTTANCFEGTGPTPAPSNTTAVLRGANGCTETDQNATDFASGAPNPRNTTSPVAVCGGAAETLTLSCAPTTFSETAGAGASTCTVMRTGSTAAALMVTLASNDTTEATVPASVTIAINSPSAMFPVDAVDDLIFDGTQTVMITASATGFNGGTATLMVTDNEVFTCAPTQTIAQIQGSGNTSPFAGQMVTTSGVVTALRSNGFFIQMPVGDGDPNTSDGVFVFTSSAPPAGAAIGASVCVSATVSEFIPSADPLSPPLTELTFATVTQLSTGNPLPAPVVLTSADTGTGGVNSGSIENLERYEGMRVSVASLTVVAPTEGNVNEPNATSTSNGVFYGVITGVPRPLREPGIAANDPAPMGSIPPIPRFDGNPERLRVDSDAQPGTTAINVAAGQTITNLVGPLDYAFRTYTILPDLATPPTVSPALSATPLTLATANEFTVASFNLERFFDTTDDPGVSDPVLTTTAFNNRLNKASLAIRNVLRAPDILGVEEVENLTTLQSLATKINNDAVAASQPNPNYVAYLVEGNDVGGIDVGFLVKTAVVTGATPRVTVNAVVQEGKTAMYTNPNTGTMELLNDRPPLRLMAVVNNADGRSFPITVIAIHNRSLSGVDDQTPSGTGTEGARVRAKRQAQAVFVANLIQARQMADPTERIVAVGDYNAFQFNDGFADAVGTIRGVPSPDNTTAVPGDGVDLVNPDLIEAASLLAPSDAYSFVFDGNAQLIDHELINAALAPFIDSVSIAHVNVDFPETYRNDATRPERISDHDGPVVYFKFADAPDLSLTKTHTGSFTIGSTGQYMITVSSAAGATAGPTTGAISVIDTLPGNLTLASFSGAGWTCTGVGTANVVCSSAGPLAAGASLPTLTLTVNVGAGTPSSISNTATVTTPGETLTANNSATDPATVVCPVITVGPATLPGALRGVAYSETLTATGGSGNFNFSAAPGSLPEGLSLSSSGGLVGAPINPGSFTFTVTATDDNGCTGTAMITLIVNTAPVGSIFDPFGCTGPGDLLTVRLTLTNSADVAQSVTATATLPDGLIGVPGSGTSDVGTVAPPVITATSATLMGTLAAGQIANITYQVQVSDVTSGTILTINTASLIGGVSADASALATVTCPGITPGAFYPSSSEISSQKAGSVLFYNFYTSTVSSTTQNTRISITNTDPAVAVAVHLFFVDGTTCSVADVFLCLSPNQTASLMASDLDPGTTGYIIAVASDLRTGCPINFNHLIGDEFIKLSSGHMTNLGAEAFAALAGAPPVCDLNSVTATLRFDGVSYNRAPRVLALDNVTDNASGNNTILVINRVGGNLLNGANPLSTLVGLLYDDQEISFSFSLPGGSCQLRGTLNSSFVRTAPPIDQVIPAGRTGWLKIYDSTDAGILGAALTFNPNLNASPGAYNGGHNLHKLRLSATSSLTIPIFPPNC